MSQALKIGRCIYCSTPQGSLTKEHIIPRGLKGSWVLQDASCERCQTITSAFEGHVLGQAFLPARYALGFPINHDKPKTYPLKVEQEGKFTEIQVPIDEYPAVILFPTFQPPAYLDGREYVGGIQPNGHWQIQVGGLPVEAVAKRYGARTFRFTMTFRGHSYARLIAKVAYGIAVADLGLDCIEDAYVLPAIVGNSNDIGRWFGCDGETRLTSPHYLHGVGSEVVNGEIISRVRLFAQYGAPECTVIVGRIAKGAQPGEFVPPR